VNCPKCGYSQEERLDCRKCGLVFSKYFAIHPPNKTVTIDELEPAPQQTPPPAVESPTTEVADLRQSFRELTRRFNEVEFERAERSQLRGEIRVLDQKLKASLDQLQERLSSIEEQVGEPGASTPSATPEDIKQLKSDLLEEHLAPLSGRLEQVEAGLRAIPSGSESASDSQSAEAQRKLELRVAQSESDIASLAELLRNQGDGSSGSGDLSKGIEELRVSLQNVSVRYSEIGDLKKNHLVLLNKMEALERQVEQLSNSQERGASNRVPELETEVSALRAEVRQSMKRLEALESSAPADSQQLSAVRDELTASKRLCSEQSEKLQSSVGEMLQRELAPFSGLAKQMAAVDQRQQSLEKCFDEVSAGRKEASEKIEDIARMVSVFRSEQEKLRSELRWSEEKITALLARPPEEPRPPLEEDVHAIRETLEEFQRFLNSVTKKP
jgi:chromosome segregation ATPase